MHRDVCGDGSDGKMSPLPSTPPSPPPSPEVAVASSASASSIGVNLRVTGHCSQGGRKYMEDFFSVAYHQSENAKDLEYAFVGIYDGHGGSEAATFAKEHLMMEIINQKLFWSNSDQDVLRAIREGYIATHYAMWREQEKWPKTATGLPSTAGTTATVAFIRREKIYIGHVGDSGIVLGYQNPDEGFWRAKQLTQDHKPESAAEKARITNAGGKVVVKSGVPRVVWNRPRTGHKGPVRRSTPIDEIPFLAVARSLGDLWSYNSALNEFVVSPDPDVKVIKINPKTFRCLIFGTDGLWNVISPAEAVDTVREKEYINERISRMRVESSSNWCNPSKGLVEKALRTWGAKKMRADNTSVVTVILYPPGANPTKYTSTDEKMGSFGLEYMQMSAELHPRDNYVHILSHSNQQKILPNSYYETEHQLYDTDSFNQSHQLPHYDTIAPSSAMRMHLQQQQSLQDGYMPSYLDRDDNVYTNSYETNCDNRYFYYEDQTSIGYMNSFAESYNSLLTSSLEREESVRNSDVAINSNCNNDDSVNCNPNEYHSYHSLHHTGLAGHDKVQHHYANNEYEMEQLLYQEQCMSAEEGYSLTKLETRGEQQLRGNGQNTLSCVQTFQIFDAAQSLVAHNTAYNQYNNISSSYQEGYGPAYLNQYERESNCYEPNMDTSLVDDLSVPSGTTTSLCIERLDTLDMDRLTAEVAEAEHIKAPLEVVEGEKIEEELRENPDETIQIHEITSSVIEDAPVSPLPEVRQPPQPPEVLVEATPTEQPIQPAICESSTIIDSTPFKKPSIPKLVLYPNVPNENHRTSRRPSMQQYPRNFEKRMLRSMTVDYSKRTLRSRNSLSKDLKAKSTLNTNPRRSTVLQSKFIKAITSSANAENSSVISRKCLNLRSRQITTTTGLWPAVSPASSSATSSTTGQRLQRNSKPISFYENSNSSKAVTTPRMKGNNGGSSSSPLLIRAVGSRLIPGSTQINHSPQITVSFAKKTSLKNSNWSSVKTTIQTRNRVQKRLNR